MTTLKISKELKNESSSYRILSFETSLAVEELQNLYSIGLNDQEVYKTVAMEFADMFALGMKSLESNINANVTINRDSSLKVFYEKDKNGTEKELHSIEYKDEVNLN